MFLYTPHYQYCTITGVTNKNAKNITIPEYINSYQVVAIASDVFKNNINLEEIHIPDSIATIHNEAFCGCVNLKLVHFYQSAETRDSITLHRAVFQNCIQLKAVLFDNPTILSFVVDSSRCFYDCHSLRTINGFLSWSIPGHTFHNCYELDNLTFKQEILNGITFASTSLTGCRRLRNVTFLGNLSSGTPANVLNKLKKMNIKCPSNVNVVDLRNLGANIQIIPKVKLPTDSLPNWLKNSEVSIFVNS